MSIKYCDQHEDCERQKLYRRFCAALAGIILLALLIVLIVWLVLRPSKPHFFLNNVDIVCINVSSSALTVTMQATLAARNPNDRVGIFYDRADVYAEYRGMQVTVATALPSIFQGHNDATVWAPFVSGADVPLPPYLATALAKDETAGYLLVTIRVDGWIRWKLGVRWITGHYHLRVRCPALLTVNDGHGSYGSNAGGGQGYFKFNRAAPCVVDV